jgi:hypothetical protein
MPKSSYLIPDVCKEETLRRFESEIQTPPERAQNWMQLP